MAETKQISATIDVNVANSVLAMAEQQDRSFSQMVEILLKEAVIKKTFQKKGGKQK